MASDFGIDLRMLLAQLSGFPIGDKDYVSYFVNDSGERLIFVQQRGEAAATLLHSDLDWEPRPVKGFTTTMADTATPAQKKTLENVSIGGGLLSTPMCGATILGRDEAKWLDACYSASEPLRDVG
ncbi:hypothetical protein [Streptomyces sp. NRRL B-1347]|uniref:hypothetical protein n=1 Tax=Streptomyces sp. NRRL B-1347 TaxID=1476877 RepID=UPI00131B746B|nr:hypothetical protein [Streptomyces sp. NRRL B-1347]